VFFLVEILLSVVSPGGAPSLGDGDASVPARVRRVRRGGVEHIEGVWIEAGQAQRAVTVLCREGSVTLEEAEGHLLNVVEPVALALLDRSPRPRGTTRAGMELESGVIFRAGERLGVLLLHKTDIAVLAVMFGWPPPRELPVGHDLADLLR
jgi:hypothetical protein